MRVPALKVVGGGAIKKTLGHSNWPFQLDFLFPVRGRVAFQPPEKKKKNKKNCFQPPKKEKNQPNLRELNSREKRKKLAKFR